MGDNTVRKLLLSRSSGLFVVILVLLVALRSHGYISDIVLSSYYYLLPSARCSTRT